MRIPAEVGFFRYLS